jgi:hypothetical protein
MHAPVCRFACKGMHFFACCSMKTAYYRAGYALCMRWHAIRGGVMYTHTHTKQQQRLTAVATGVATTGGAGADAGADADGESGVCGVHHTAHTTPHAAVTFAVAEPRPLLCRHWTADPVRRCNRSWSTIRTTAVGVPLCDAADRAAIWHIQQPYSTQ